MYALYDNWDWLQYHLFLLYMDKEWQLMDGS